MSYVGANSFAISLNSTPAWNKPSAQSTRGY